MYYIRPLYQDLDPFLWYLDSLTSIQGNPLLIPEYLNQFEYSLSWKQFVLRLGYTISEKTIWAITKPGFTGLNSQIYIKDNLKNRFIQTIGLDLPFETKKYNTFNTLSCNFYQIKDPKYSLKKIQPMFYIYSYHQLVLEKLFNLEFTFEYYGKSTDGFTQKQPYYYFTAGISRSFFKEKLNVQMVLNDIARTARFKGERTLNTFTNNYNQRYNSQYFRVTLTYNFSNLSRFNYKNKNVNESEFNRIKK